jgi:hypothetical protein
MRQRGPGTSIILFKARQGLDTTWRIESKWADS